MDPNDFKPTLTKQAERYLNKVQSELEYCVYCQPYDDGEAVWILGQRMDIEDLLDNCDVPEKESLRESILAHLHCPNCGSESFEFGSEVGVKTSFEKEVDAHYDKAYKLFGKDVSKFQQELEVTPLLAFENKLAQKIYKEIQKGGLPEIQIKGEFYRARRVEGSEVFKRKDMLTPPLGKPSEGRFNHAGQTHLYLSNSKETALKEAAIDSEQALIWWQRIRITKEIPKILDLSFEWDQLTPSTSTLLISLHSRGAITRSDRNKANWKPDYYLTRFLMDCAKKSGYNGIKYNSTKAVMSYNVVLFHPEKFKISAIGKPEVEKYEDEDKFKPIKPISPKKLNDLLE